MKENMGRISAVVAGTVTLAVLGGMGGAVAGDLIGSDDIKDNTIEKRDIRKGVVAQFLASTTGQQGPQGDKGDTGPAGPTGATGPAGTDGEDGDDGANGADGVSGYEVRKWDYALVFGGGIATMTCPVGKIALGGGYWIKNEAAMTNGTTVVASFPGVMDWTTNTPKATGDPLVDSRGWIVQVNKPANVNPGAMTVYVTCATMEL